MAADLGVETIEAHPLWSPDTPAAVMAEYEQVSDDWHLDEFNFVDTDRWSSSATSGWGLGQGDPITLTWSIVPDGTPVGSFNGEGAGDSDLISFLDGIYGGGGGSDLTKRPWFSIVESVFDRYEELSGIDFVYSAQDDGAAMQTTSLPGGVLGVRGDVRLSGHAIDGNSGTLAYAFYPDYGDMVIDTTDSYFNNVQNDSRGLRNTIAHELGHGLGLFHINPINGTKLMEPRLTQAFDGPQYDDILAIHRGYGDVWEKDGGNETRGTATNLGSLSIGGTLTIGADATGDRIGATQSDFVSIDDASDVDFFRFNTLSSGQVSISLAPMGGSYANGGGTLVGSEQSDLRFEVWAQGGSSPLAVRNQGGLGAAESLQLDLAAGTYYVAVRGADSRAQFYQLDVSMPGANPGTIDSAQALGDFNADGRVDIGDIAVWRDNVGATDAMLPVGSTNDGSGTVDTGEYATWKANFNALTSSVEDGGATLHLTGNLWRAIALPTNLTAGSVLEFDFRSTSEGEIHAIGFDTDLAFDSEGAKFFKLHGTQAWGATHHDNYTPAGWQHYQIPVGQSLSGNQQYLVFGMDHDVSSPDGNSYFSNVRINGTAVNFNNYALESYGGAGQKPAASVATIEDNAASSAPIESSPTVEPTFSEALRLAGTKESTTDSTHPGRGRHESGRGHAFGRTEAFVANVKPHQRPWHAGKAHGPAWRHADQDVLADSVRGCSEEAIDQAFADEMELPWHGLRKKLKLS